MALSKWFEMDEQFTQPSLNQLGVLELCANFPLMYTPNKEYMRHIVLFEFQKGNTASWAVAKTLKDTYGNDVVYEKTYRRSHFKKDDFSLKDEPRTGYSKKTQF
ncbi:hypothetical protein ACTXT7_002070 [Hymenolepis weldensis]